MKRIDHPHLGINGICGPPGTLIAQFHSSCPVEGVTWQCSNPIGTLGHREPCGTIYTASWDALDAENTDITADDPRDTIRLPPCPSCGAVTFVSHNDVEYGLDYPEHHTMRVVREHIAKRPAFRHLSVCPAAAHDGSHQGRDFSHLPKHQRPAHHQPVDLSAEYPLEQHGES